MRKMMKRLLAGVMAVALVLPNLITGSIVEAATAKAIFAGHTAQEVMNAAASGLGNPYKYGGTTTSGWDCSGYVTWVARKFDVDMGRTTININEYCTNAGATVMTGDSASDFNTAFKNGTIRPADIIIFKNASGTPVHAAIVGKNYTIYHAWNEDDDTLNNRFDEVWGVNGGHGKSYTSFVAFRGVNVEGKLKLTKTSSETSITNGNNCYSLEGAVYGVYGNSGCTTKVGTLTTTADGTTNTLTLDAGTYYVKEITAPKGYELDTKVYTATVTSEKTTTLEVNDKPMSDPIAISITKINPSNSNNIPSLAGTQFTIKYYAGYYTKETLPNQATKTWIIETKEVSGMYICSLRDSYKVGGDEFYYVDGNSNPIIPLGTVTVEETKPAPGYTLVGGYLQNSNGAKIDGKYVTQVTGSDNNLGILVGGNEFTVANYLLHGGIAVQKYDKDLGNASTQGSASLAGAKFAIKNANDYSVSVGGKTYAKGETITTITTDANGYAATAKDLLPYGSYTVEEIAAPGGYTLSGTNLVQTVKVDKENTLTSAGAVLDNVIRGGISVQKKDKASGTAVAQGMGTLAGAEFAIISKNDKTVVVNGHAYAKGETVMTITTDANGYATTGNNVLPYGVYELKETKAPAGYTLSGDNLTQNITISQNGVIVKAADVLDVALYGGISVQKHDIELGANKAQGSATLAGAEFTIRSLNDKAIVVSGKTYNKGDVITTIVTDANGYAATGVNVLPYGVYEVEETKAPTGYVLSGNTIKQTVTVDKASLVNAKVTEDKVIRGGLEVQKMDNATQSAVAQGTASLKGAEFTITSLNDKAVVVNGKSYAKGEVVMTIVTDDSGKAKASSDALPYGVYELKEIKAPAGYALSGKNLTQTVTISQNGVIVKAENVYDDILYGGISVQKHDIELGANKAQGGATLAGAEFTIRSLNDKAIVVNGKTYNKGDVITVLTTDADGNARTPEGMLPYGVYEVEETKAPTGYKLKGENLKQTVTISANGTTSTGNTKDEVIRGGLEVHKLDIQTGTASAQGNGTLSGAEFAIISKNDKAVIVNGKSYTKGENVMTIVTDANGIAKTGSNVLPYGVYELKETKAPDGYLLKGENLTQEITIASDNTIVKAKDVKDTAVRGDFELSKIEHYTGRVMSGIPFRITSKLTGESHIVVTDNNGYYSSAAEYIAHTKDTNKGTAGSGLWFELNQDGTKVPVSDVYGALPRGTYLIEELRCDANKKTDLYKGEFTISSNGSVYNIGTIENYEISIHTTAVNNETGKDFFPLDKEVTLKDTVSCYGLVIGETYELRGVLMDKATGKPLLIDGKEVTAQSVFVAEKREDEIDVMFTFDASKLAGKTLVVFEELYVDGSLLVEHKDINDEKQTVYFPEIGTDLGEEETKANVVKAGKITLVDVVTYKGLEIGKTYTISGILMDKATGKAITDKDGKNVVSEAKFVAEESNGAIEIPFEFDASHLAGTTIVAFETLYQGDMEYAVHADINDKKQTVYIPEIGTKASNEATGDNFFPAEGEVVLKDVVSYKGLEPGNTYKLIGVLMNRATGEPVKVKGEIIQGVTAFKPVKSSGETTVEFKFNASDLAGKVVVVFEELYINETLLEEHKDINDKGQTVYFPEIGTTLYDTDGEMHTVAAGKITLIDTIAYKGLEPGKEYTAKGVLMDKATGKEILDKDRNKITSSVTFTPDKSNGYADVVFTFDASHMKGKTIVAFETLYRSDVEYAVHADINDEAQTVYIPSIGTSALEKGTGHDFIHADKEVTIIDTVSYEGLLIGKEYKVSGILMDKSTGKPLLVNDKEVTVEKLFTPETKDGRVAVEFTFDASALAGKAVVVFEELYLDAELVGEHKDINDEGQTIYFPEIATTLYDTFGNMNVVKAGVIELIDSVEYIGLEPGKEYTVFGTLMDKATGKEVLDKDGKAITSSVTFVPDEKDGYVDVVFEFDASHLEGTTIVAFETLYQGDKEYAVHADINDEKQTVYIPEIGTSATDKTTGNDFIHADKEVTIVDTVTYTNLLAGEEYKVSGILMDKTTRKPLLVDDKEVTAETVFTAEASDGKVIVEFTFDASALAGKAVVVFEELYLDKELVAEHKDIEDEGQTIYFPEIGTSFIDKESGKDIISAGPVKLTDTVSYIGLEPGKEYTVTGVLMDKATGKEALDKDGNVITAETTFVAETMNGSVDVVFEFDALHLEGTELVAFETLYQEDKEYAVHADMEDEEQTVYIPEIGTTLVEEETGSHVVKAEEITLVDTVDYKGLKPGVDYTMTGVLMDKATGEKVLDKDGKEIMSSVTFTPETTDGSVDVIFTFDATHLEGTTIVAFETLYHEDMEYAVHADIEDEAQMVYIPEIGTSAADKETGNDFIHASENVTITDTVTYTDLLAGNEYKVSGILMDKATGEPLLVNDMPVVSETVFVAESETGSVEVDFTFDASLLAGKAIVVFEELYMDTLLVAEHKDIEDEGQTVYFPEIGTTLLDKENSSNIVMAGQVTLIDTVTYKGLEPGKEYTVSGILMDKDMQEPVLDKDGKEITSSTTFVAETGEGMVEVVFEFDASHLAGDTIVAFETLYQGDKEYAVHADINDEKQTVFIPVIGTMASDKADGDKEMTAEGTLTIMDRVAYENLIVGQKYLVKGVLMDKKTGKELLVNGKTVTSEMTFIAESDSGYVDMEFVFDGTDLGKMTIVVFEEMYILTENTVEKLPEEGTDIPTEGETVIETVERLIASHKDIEDEGQTVELIPPVVIPPTGDNMFPITMLAAGLAFIAIAIVKFRGTKKNKIA